MQQAVWDLKAQFNELKGKDVFDCLLAEFLLSEGRFVHSHEKVLEQYAAQSLDELAQMQQARFTTLPKLKKLYEEVEMPLIPVLLSMEQHGIMLDTKRLREVGEEIEKELVKVEDGIKKEVGFDINLNSPIQVGNFLAEKAGVPLAKTKTGKYATSELELVKFREQFPIIDKLLSFRELAKLRSTYVESLITKVDGEGRVHTTYSQVGASTGRLSSSNPNLQNIPVTSAMGQKIKSCFIASHDSVLVSFDYSQQELRILAHLTGEEKLVTAFNENRDVHKITASQLFSVSYEDVTKAQRSVGKTINFGIIYGMSSFGLSQSMNIPVEEADVFIKKFYETYPKIKSFYDLFFAKAKIDGYVETLLGRRRYVFEYPKQKFIDNNTRRVLLNFPIQGTAADLMKLAMIKIFSETSDDDHAHLLLQIHDDLVFEIEDGDAKRLNDIIMKIKKIMCEVYPLSVPIEVDVKTGKSWGEMTEYKI